ncbi:hypothetical protein J2T13_000219 [Paenibacillus sp. DS2015]|uniref:hypothetical protein n=1 Tax=Paenibacillus sp. DS2015 TaxID=3373917 RepID=UPI003D26116E
MGNVIVLKHTQDFRGDHGADVTYTYSFEDTTTLADVIREVNPTFADSIEIPAKGARSE